MLLWIAGFSLLGSVGAVAGAGLFLLFPTRIRRVLVPCLVSYATGTLLAAALLSMIPAAIEEAPVLSVTATVLAGMVLFFVLEKLVIWRHAHGEAHAHPDVESARGRAGSLILIGDGFHNFVDGVMLSAAFLTSLPIGIAAGLAVIAHEVPQEVGDFAILLDSGFERGRALIFNELSAAATLPGALVAYFALGESRGMVPYVLALSAASFLYIAEADLIPELHQHHRHPSFAASLRQVSLLLAGIGTISLLRLAH